VGTRVKINQKKIDKQKHRRNTGHNLKPKDKTAGKKRSTKRDDAKRLEKNHGLKSAEGAERRTRTNTLREDKLGGRGQRRNRVKPLVASPWARCSNGGRVLLKKPGQAESGKRKRKTQKFGHV